jgi:hypothetical protein
MGRVAPGDYSPRAPTDRIQPGASRSQCHSPGSRSTLADAGAAVREGRSAGGISEPELTPEVPHCRPSVGLEAAVRITSKAVPG